MKPLGTITNPFPFLEQEVTKALESLMASSRNYSDFLDRLLFHILENESPPMMVFYTSIQFYDAKGLDYLEPILNKYQDLPLIQPYIVSFKMTSEEATSSDLLQSADRVLFDSRNPWVCFRMHLLRYLCAHSDSVGSLIEENALQQLENLIETYTEMACFEPQILGLRSDILRSEGRIEKALELLESRNRKAQSYDDLAQVYGTHITLAYTLRNVDTNKAIELLDRAEEISKELGYNINEFWAYFNIRASVHNPRGEYDLSLQCYQQAFRARESQRLEVNYRGLPLNVSWLYSELEDGENALEWAKIGTTQSHFLSTEGNFIAIVLSRLARAFTLLGNLDQAEKYLKESETQTRKIGSDVAISENHIIAGHIEFAKGNLEAAMYNFERGLEIAQQINYQNRINSCLIGLVRTEIAMLKTDEAISLRETSGPWMKLLQSEIERKELPGIRGRFLLLKTELRLKQGRYEEASILLEEIRNLAKEPGLKYLDQKASELQLKNKLGSRR